MKVLLSSLIFFSEVLFWSQKSAILKKAVHQKQSALQRKAPELPELEKVKELNWIIQRFYGSL